jgi:hypothetical protein
MSMARIMKRKTAMTSRKVYKRKQVRGKKKSLMGVKNIRAVVNKVLARKIETKQSTSTVTDGTAIKHNSFVVLDPTANFLRTVAGTGDPMTGAHRRYDYKDPSIQLLCRSYMNLLGKANGEHIGWRNWKEWKTHSAKMTTFRRETQYYKKRVGSPVSGTHPKVRIPGDITRRAGGDYTGAPEATGQPEIQRADCMDGRTWEH